MRGISAAPQWRPWSALPHVISEIISGFILMVKARRRPRNARGSASVPSVTRVPLPMVQSGCFLARRACSEFAPARPNYDRRSAIFRSRACVCQIAILTIQLIRQIAASSTDPSIIKPPDDKRRAIRKRHNFRRVINPEADVLFSAQGRISSRRIYDNYFFC